jgi:plastocyanin
MAVLNGGKDFMCVQGQTFAFNAKTAICVLCSAVSLLSPTERAEATTVTNYLNYPSYYRWQYSLGVNVGDTVVWVNQWPTNSGTNYVESYGGEWKSPPLNSGDSFSFTFTNAGFFAYRARDAFGTVTVMAWTNAPPALTINTLVDGFVLASNWQVWVQASVTNPENLAQIEYFANSTFIGTATNSPFGVWWFTMQEVPRVLMAKATDRQGGVTWSPPVNVTVGGDFDIWGPRLLPTGEFLFFYHVDWVWGGQIGAADTPLLPLNICNFNHYTYSNLASVGWPGVFVDESVRGGARPRRFYRVIHGVNVCP